VARFGVPRPQPFHLRLLPPDRKPQTISFHLGKLLQGDEQQNHLLQNQDRVIIFAKTNLKETPQVNVSGEIQNPGKYPLVEKMRVKDLIYKAGNLKRSAYLESAEITRFIKRAKMFLRKSSIFLSEHEGVHCVGIEDDSITTSLIRPEILKRFTNKMDSPSPSPSLKIEASTACSILCGLK
jgi:protein involved in polysaccharide export with SLBB domain